MMRILGSLWMTAVLLGLVPVFTFAQGGIPRSVPGTDSPRFVDYFVSRQQLDFGRGERRELDGVGGRIMWSLAPFTGPEHSSLLARTAIGGYVVHTPAWAELLETWQYGVQTDLQLTQAPLGGRIEPLVSLGIGAIRIKEPGERLRGAPEVPSAEIQRPSAPGESTRPAVLSHFPVGEVDPPAHTTMSLSLSPGIGMRVRLFPGIDLRSDLRTLIDARDGARRALELAGGLSVRL